MLLVGTMSRVSVRVMPRQVAVAGREACVGEKVPLGCIGADAALAGGCGLLDGDRGGRVEDNMPHGIDEREPLELALDVHAHGDRHDGARDGTIQMACNRGAGKGQRAAVEADRPIIATPRDAEGAPRRARAGELERAGDALVDTGIDLGRDLLPAVAHEAQDRAARQLGDAVGLDRHVPYDQRYPQPSRASRAAWPMTGRFIV